MRVHDDSIPKPQQIVVMSPSVKLIFIVVSGCSSARLWFHVGEGIRCSGLSNIEFYLRELHHAGSSAGLTREETKSPVPCLRSSRTLSTESRKSQLRSYLPPTHPIRLAIG